MQIFIHVTVNKSQDERYTNLKVLLHLLPCTRRWVPFDFSLNFPLMRKWPIIFYFDYSVLRTDRRLGFWTDSTRRTDIEKGEVKKDFI